MTLPQNEIKLKKIARLAKLGSVPVYEEISALEDKNLTLEQALLDAQNTFKEHINIIDGILHQLEDKKLDKEVFQAFGGEVKQALKTIQLIPGPKGERGEKGETGHDGKDGRDGLTGRDGLAGKDGESIVGPKGLDGSPDTPEQIADKLNLLGQAVEQNVIIGLVDEIKKLREEISRKPNQMTGMRKVPIIQAVNLTNQVNGVTTTYTLPSDTVKVLAVFSTQFPVVFDGSTDFSFAGRTLTINTGVVQSGQTLNCLIEALFYSK
mgnify:CR=1 FL=1